MAKIPQEWLLPSSVLEEGKARRDITGDFIDGLLDPEARMITNFDARELIDSMSNGSLTVFQVIKAFCKRAACAHQLVRMASVFSSFTDCVESQFARDRL